MLLNQIGILGGLSSSDLGLKNRPTTFIAMLKSRTIEDRLIDSFDLRKASGVKRYQDRARSWRIAATSWRNEKERFRSV